MEIFTTQNFIAFLTLLALEIVLGIDNVIFVAILSAKLPPEQRDFGRKLGIGLAVITRVLLLLGISWVMGLTKPLITLFSHGLTGRDLILLIGGLFLIGKSTVEIHEKLEVEEHVEGQGKKTAVSLTSVIVQIILLDIVFSLDSVITAVGISGVLAVMIPAVLIASAVMLFASSAISTFVEKHPSFKILALSFLILIGVLLVIEGWNPEVAHELHIKNYAYFAMAFSVMVDFLQLQLKKQKNPVKLHNSPRLPTK